MIALACSLSGAGVAYGQTARQDIETRTEAVEPRPAPLTGATVQFTSQRPPSNADEIVFVLNAIDIGGGEVYDEAVIRGLYEDKLGREVTLREVYDVAGAIQGLYRNDGYAFTRVLVPAQEIVDGAVRIEIIEAVIESVTVEEPADPIGDLRELIVRMTEPLVGLANPTSQELERVLITINDIPGVTRATAVPTRGGDGRGSLAIFINVERDPFEAIVYGDNRQTPGVGRGIVGATATFSSYSAFADTTRLSYFNSFGYLSDVGNADDGFGDFDERNTFQVEHSRIISADGLTLTGAFLASRTRPGDDLATIGLEGEQYLVQVELAQPLLRARSTSITGRVGFEWSNSTTDVSNGVFRVADDRLRVARLGLDALVRDEYGYTSFDAELRQGMDILNASEIDGTDKLSRTDGRVDFTTITATIERELVVDDNISLLVKAGGQYAFNPLLAGEEFSIGGLTFGRGFDPSEFTGDSGVGVSGELRYRTPFDLDDIQVTVEGYGFGEWGRVWNKGAGKPQRETLISAGGGVRLFLPAQYVLGLELAFPVNQPLERTQSKSGRVFVNFSKRF